MTDRITKEEVAQLDIEEYHGKIIVVQSLDVLDNAIFQLRKKKIIGFDTETRPSYKKGVIHNVSLIQLATEDTCFLFRLNKIDFPQPLTDLLSDLNITKVGLSLRDDFISIRRRSAFTPQGFVDLQLLAPEYEIKDSSLQKMYAILFNKKISKSQRLTNWDAEELTESQQKYAALDAWACLKIYTRLKELNQKGEIKKMKD